MSTSETTLVCDIEVTNRAGIHTRVALMIFKTMESFSASASITNKNTGQTADCRSILELLSLGAACGDTVALAITGSDAETLQLEIQELFERNFYEDEAEETKG